MNMNIKLTETIRQKAVGVLPLSTQKQKRLRALLTLFLVMLAGQLLADSWLYTYSPEMGTEWTYTGSGTTQSFLINTNTQTVTNTLTNYTNGVIKATVYGHTSSGTITFRLKKDDGSQYFNANQSGYAYVHEVGNDILYYKQFYISNSTTDHVDVVANVGNFSGLRSFRIFMIKSDGQKFFGGTIYITGTGIFPPTATTHEATKVYETTAQLNGSVNANGAETTYYYLYGTSRNSLSKKTTARTISKNMSAEFPAEISNLLSGTSYYFRIYASNSEGEDYGDILTFTTEAPANNAPLTPSYTNPAKAATDVSKNVTFSWTCSDPDGDALTYYLYCGTSTSSWSKYTTNNKSYTLSLDANTKYYWKVEAYDGKTTTTGPTWYFTTSSSSSGDDNELEQAVTYLYQRNIIEGSTVSAANTSNPLLRQHLAKMAFYGAYGSESAVPPTVPSDNYPSVYDLNVGTYYYRAVKALLYLEYGDGVTPFDRNRLTFEPTEEMARIHVLKALMEAFNRQPDMSNTALPFTDLSSLDSQPRLKGYLRKAVSLGIVNTTNTTFRPSAICTRGEAILMLYRLMNKGIPQPKEDDYFQPLNTTMKTISLGATLPLGNFQHYTKTSFTLDGVVPLNFSHAYNSYNTTLPDMFFGESSSRDAYLPLADGWTHTYHTFITSIDDYVIVHWGGGSIDVYKYNGSTYEPVSMGVYDKLNVSSGTLSIKTKSQVTYYFGNSYRGVAYLTKIVDRNNNTLTISYETGQNSEPRISTVSDGNGRNLTFNYKEGTNLIHKITDPLGRYIVFGYTINGTTGRYQLSGFKDAKQNETRYYYGNSSKISTSKLLTQIKLPNGNYINNTYNDNNYRLTQTENGDSKTEVNVISNYGSSVSTSSEVKVSRTNGTSTYNYTYNANNVMTNLSGPNSMKVTVTPYTTTGKLHLPNSITTNNMNISNIVYDNNGNVTQIDVTGDGKTLTTKYEYNSMNDVTKVTDPMGYATTYTYTNGNLTKILSPISSVWIQFLRRSDGLPSQVKDAEGVTVDYSYDSYGNLNKITLPGSLVTVPAYDTAGRLTSRRDALGNIYSYEYDINDNLISETDASNKTTNYEYDANDNLTGILNAKNKKTTLEYDFDTDRLTSVEFEGATKSYSYNADGSLETYRKPDGTRLNYEYDQLGRVTSDGVNDYSYDSKLRLKSISGNGKSISFGYDGFNRITSAGDATYTYDDNSNVKSVNNTTYGYDKLNRLITVTFNGRTITYTYRNDSQLSTVDYNGVMTTTFGYDSAGRLTSKQTKLSNGKVVADYSYTLDKVGNITKQIKQEPFGDILLTNEDVSYSYNSANRITKAGDISFSFDENGNTTKRGSEAYSWDELDRLTRAGSTNITYDPLGLITSYGDITFTTDPLGMGNVLSDSKSGATYVYGLGLEARVVGSKVSYYVTDARGSVVAIVDENGNVTHKYQYDEFGKVTQKEEPAGNANYNPFQYVGKYGVMYLNDHHYYMRARHYDPTIGRFLSEDPIWSTNLYPYADNNPIMGIDPRGTLEVMSTGYEIYQGIKTVTSVGTQYGMSTATKTYIATEVAKDQAAADALIAGWGSSSSSVAATTTTAATTTSTTAASTTSTAITTSAGGMSAGATIGAVGCGVGIAATVVVLAQDGYKAVQNAKQSDSFSDFIDRQNVNGGWLYKGSQKVGDGLDSMWDAVLGPLID